MSCCSRIDRRQVLRALALGMVPARLTWAGTPYTGPLIDAHSHLPGPEALDALVAAMDRHGFTRVALLGVGGVQKQDAAWIGAAATRFPNRVLPFAPVPDPMAADAPKRLDVQLATGRFRGAGEVHVHQASRKIRRELDSKACLALLDVVARYQVPLVIHDELNGETTGELERALGQSRKAVIVLAHAGSGDPGVLRGLLGRHENLWLDLSGMHFLRTPALATEKGALGTAWGTLLTERSDRIVAGLDLWASPLFAPAMLDRLMVWTRRVLGEIPPEAAGRIAYQNATRLFRLT